MGQQKRDERVAAGGAVEAPEEVQQPETALFRPAVREGTIARDPCRAYWMQPFESAAISFG